MRTGIKHYNDWTKRTIAIELPSIVTLKALFASSCGKLNINVGVAKLHPKDQYNKLTGRTLASQKMLERVVLLRNIEFRGLSAVRIIFNFSFQHEDQIIMFGISYVPESINTRLEYVEIA